MQTILELSCEASAKIEAETILSERASVIFGEDEFVLVALKADDSSGVLLWTGTFRSGVAEGGFTSLLNLPNLLPSNNKDSETKPVPEVRAPRDFAESPLLTELFTEFHDNPPEDAEA